MSANKIYRMGIYTVFWTTDHKILRFLQFIALGDTVNVNIVSEIVMVEYSSVVKFWPYGALLKTPWRRVNKFITIGWAYCPLHLRKFDFTLPIWSGLILHPTVKYHGTRQFVTGRFSSAFWRLDFKPLHSSFFNISVNNKFITDILFLYSICLSK